MQSRLQVNNSTKEEIQIPVGLYCYLMQVTAQAHAAVDAQGSHKFDELRNNPAKS